MNRPQVFALYCSELPAREAALRAHLRERNVPATFVRGFHGATWGLETSREYEPGKRLPPGHVGLNLGAWSMWCRAADTPPPGAAAVGADPLVFFEDDVELPADFWAEMSDLNAELASACPDWDLVFLGLADSEPGVWSKVAERLGGPAGRLARLTDPFGTHALMVRRRAVPVLLEHMRAAERNLDQQLFRNVLEPGHLRWAAVLPSLVKQRTFDYAGRGHPEWAASTLRPDPAPPAEPPPPAEAPLERTMAYVDPFPCVYRGEPRADHARTPTPNPATGRFRTVPMSQCARLNVPCHSKPDTDAEYADEPVRPCQTCDLRRQMQMPPHRGRLPVPEGHFNPSLIRWDGRLLLATRDSWGHSKVALWELRNTTDNWTGDWTVSPLGSFASGHPAAPRLEDPRLFEAPHPRTGAPALHAMFNLPDAYPPKRVRVGYVRFAPDLSGIEETTVLPSPAGNAYEKNWAPFVPPGEDGLHWVYAAKPEHVVLGPGTNHVTPNPLPWTGGVVRGGAAPVLWHQWTGDLMSASPVFYSFFHGCLKRFTGSVYTIGCYVFDARPPFRVLRQTATPLMWPSEAPPDEGVVKRFVLWPGGAVRQAGAWHVAVGVDDTFCQIVRLPFAVVEAALSDVPAPDGTVSLRDGPIAHGIKVPE